MIGVVALSSSANAGGGGGGELEESVEDNYGEEEYESGNCPWAIVRPSQTPPIDYYRYTSKTKEPGCYYNSQENAKDERYWMRRDDCSKEKGIFGKTVNTCPMQ